MTNKNISIEIPSVKNKTECDDRAVKEEVERVDKAGALKSDHAMSDAPSGLLTGASSAPLNALKAQKPHRRRPARRVKRRVRRALENFERLIRRSKSRPFVHPTYQQYAKRRFNPQKIRAGISPIAANVALLRAAVRVRTRTLRYAPLARVPPYYCRRCGLSSDYLNTVADHICSRKMAAPIDHKDLEKLMAGGTRSRVRDAAAVLERIAHPQWARLSRYPSRIHYDFVDRLFQPSTLMDIAYKSVERTLMPDFFTAVNPATDHVDERARAPHINNDAFEEVEFDGESTRIYRDLDDDEEERDMVDSKNGAASLGALEPEAEDSNEASTSFAPENRGENSAPRAYSLQELMEDEKFDYDSLEDDHTMETCRADDGVGYLCTVCYRLFATFASYDTHLAASGAARGKCALIPPEPMEIEIGRHEKFPASGRKIRIPDEDEFRERKLFCTKCYRSDFRKLAQFHQHIFDCALL